MRGRMCMVQRVPQEQLSSSIHLLWRSFESGLMSEGVCMEVMRFRARSAHVFAPGGSDGNRL